MDNNRVAVQNFKTHNKGFTLVEIVVAMAILGILASLAIPSFASTLSSMATKKGTLHIISYFDEARSKAGLVGKPVTLTVSDSNKVYTIAVPGITNNTKHELEERLAVSLSTVTPPVGTNPETVTPVSSNRGIVITSTGRLDSSYRLTVCDSRFSGTAGYQIDINSFGVSSYKSMNNC